MSSASSPRNKYATSIKEAHHRRSSHRRSSQSNDDSGNEGDGSPPTLVLRDSVDLYASSSLLLESAANALISHRKTIRKDFSAHLKEILASNRGPAE